MGCGFAEACFKETVGAASFIVYSAGALMNGVKRGADFVSVRLADARSLSLFGWLRKGGGGVSRMGGVEW